MSNRTAYPGTEISTDYLDTTHFDLLPGGWIGYAQITSSVGSLTSAAQITGLSQTVTVNTSRRLKITGFGSIYADANNEYGQMQIVDTTSGSTVLAKAFQGNLGNAAIPAETELVCVAVVTPSSGSRTYELRAGRAGPSGATFTINATSTNPAFILIEDIGPA